MKGEVSGIRPEIFKPDLFPQNCTSVVELMRFAALKGLFYARYC